MQKAKGLIDSTLDKLEETSDRIRSQIEKFVSTDSKDTPAEVFKQMEASDPFIAELFIISEDKEPHFPLFSPLYVIRDQPVSLTESRDLNDHPQLSDAENLEFRQKDYQQAAEQYARFFQNTTSKQAKADLLNRIARCWNKGGQEKRALQSYDALIKNFSLHRDENGLPYGLIGRYQMASVYEKIEVVDDAVLNQLQLFESLVQGDWKLTKPQFIYHLDRTKETVSKLFPQIKNGETLKTYREKWKSLALYLESNMRRTRSAQILVELFNPPASLLLPETAGRPFLNFKSNLKGEEWYVVGFLPLAAEEILGEMSYISVLNVHLCYCDRNRDGTWI